MTWIATSSINSDGRPYGVGGPLGDWLQLSLTSSELFIMTDYVLAIFSECIFFQHTTMHTDNHLTVSVRQQSMPVKHTVLSVNKTMPLKLVNVMPNVSSRYRVLGLCKRLMHECHETIQSQSRKRGGSMQS